MSSQQDGVQRPPPGEPGAQLRAPEVPVDEGASDAGRPTRPVADPSQDVVPESAHEVEETGAPDAPDPIFYTLRYRGYYTVSQKKQDTKLLVITSPIIIRFSKFFHYQTL